MDGVDQTRDAYESDSDSYVEKYQSYSVAAAEGEPFVEAMDGSELLDLGCGPGADIETFVDGGFDVIGIDITRPFLEEADESIPETTVIQGDMRALPFQDDSFDGIWALASFHHVPRSEATPTLEECRRILKAGGKLSLSVKHSKTGPEESRHFEYYQPTQLHSRLTAAGFETIRLETDEHWVWGVATN